MKKALGRLGLGRERKDKERVFTWKVYRFVEKVKNLENKDSNGCIKSDVFNLYYADKDKTAEVKFVLELFIEREDKENGHKLRVRLVPTSQPGVESLEIYWKINVADKTHRQRLVYSLTDQVMTPGGIGKVNPTCHDISKIVDSVTPGSRGAVELVLQMEVVWSTLKLAPVPEDKDEDGYDDDEEINKEEEAAPRVFTNFMVYAPNGGPPKPVPKSRSILK